MKTNTRNLLICFLLMIAMLLGVLAITSQTAFAVSDTNKPAETVYVGGVALNAGQYVKTSETTPIDGAPATDYGITIADKDELGATVGVLITEENCTDVLGDGTVSYDPATNTLTLNGYKYEGEGVYFEEQGAFFCLMADVPAEGLTIVLVGENSITVSGSESAGMVFFGEGELTVKGNGSLSINTIMYGITLQSDSGKLTIENAKLNITTTGAMAICIQATDFVMTSGDVKITASMIGIGTSNKNGICINGGSVEIDSALGGYAFIYLDFEHLSFNPVKPDLSGYVGTYKMTAGINADGSDAVEFNEGYLNSYKYVKIEHIHNYGTAWKSDENNHWNECVCGDKANIAAHVDENSDSTCDVCGKTMVNPSGHKVIVNGETKYYADDESVTVTAKEPAEGKVFKGWKNEKGEIVSTDKSYTFLVTGETTLTAVYEDQLTTENGLSGGAIAGIVIGTVAVVGIGGFAIFWFVIKKKKPHISRKSNRR